MDNIDFSLALNLSKGSCASKERANLLSASAEPYFGENVTKLCELWLEDTSTSCVGRGSCVLLEGGGEGKGGRGWEWGGGHD